MTLSVIGAGFGRTGTLSMKSALEILGFGPCHHMVEVNSNVAQRDLWRAIAAGEDANWDLAFAGYRSCVDWPSAFYWRELSDYFPNAKIILTVRDAEKWYESVSHTIFPSLQSSSDPASVGVKLIAQRVFGGILNDKQHALDIYAKNIRNVQAAFDHDRLVTYKIGDGWEPLCRFLNVPVPTREFPQSNSTEEFNQRVRA
ncbi:MAG: sulfotransferase family protein [Proteobacteria bacterium]|nr:sulfotransferase family protein [Pseudomonadota bacterium]